MAGTLAGLGGSAGLGGGAGGVAGSSGLGGSAGSQSIGGAGATSTGGASGMAGTGGVSGMSGSGGTGGSAPAGVVFDDFEATATGMPPDPALWMVLTESATTSVTVSNEDAHSGTQSVKVVAGSNSNDHGFFTNTTAFPPPAGAIHFRAWVKYADAGWDGHITFIESGPDQNTEIRIGGQAGYYHANLSADGDGLSPDPFEFPECSQCVAPVASQWVCVTGSFDPTSNVVQLMVDGAQAVQASSPADWHAGTGMLPTTLTRISFGWESYGAGVANTIFYDDVTLDYQPLTCP